MMRVVAMVAGLVLVLAVPGDGAPADVASGDGASGDGAPVAAPGRGAPGPAQARKPRRRRKPKRRPTPAPTPGSGAPVEPAPPAAPADPSPAVAPAPATPAAAMPADEPDEPDEPAEPFGDGATATRKAASAHGGFVSDMDCAACHTPAGWKLSTGAGKSGFDHDRTGFPLRGAHDQTPCAGCHTGQAAVSTDCVGCHRDPHVGRMDGTCAECHRATAWTDTSALDLHRRTRMPLTGRHAVIECTACHLRQSERTWTDLPTDCYACHQADYHRPGVHPDHDGDPADPTAQRFPRDCGRCHRTATWAGAVLDPTTLPRGVFARAQRIDHDAWFVVSTGPHRTTECASCHADRRRARASRCDGCHTTESLAPQHPGRPVPRSTSACLRCHPRGIAR